jgi:hypothetical protein
MRARFLVVSTSRRAIPPRSSPETSACCARLADAKFFFDQDRRSGSTPLPRLATSFTTRSSARRPSASRGARSQAIAPPLGADPSQVDRA